MYIEQTSYQVASDTRILYLTATPDKTKQLISFYLINASALRKINKAKKKKNNNEKICFSGDIICIQFHQLQIKTEKNTHKTGANIQNIYSSETIKLGEMPQHLRKRKIIFSLCLFICDKEVYKVHKNSYLRYNKKRKRKQLCLSAELVKSIFHILCTWLACEKVHIALLYVFLLVLLLLFPCQFCLLHKFKRMK